MANKSIKDAFQRFWQHCVSSFATKEYVDNAVVSGGGGASGGGASGGGIIDVTELPAVGNEGVLYRVPVGTLCFGSMQHKAEIYCVDVRPRTGVVCVKNGTDMVAFYYEAATGYLLGYLDEATASAFGISAGWMEASLLFSFAGKTYKGVITSITETGLVDWANIYLLLEYKTYFYKNRWFCTSKEVVKMEHLPTDEPFVLPDDVVNKLASNFDNIEIHMFDNGGASYDVLYPIANLGAIIMFAGIPFDDTQARSSLSITLTTKEATHSRV